MALLPRSPIFFRFGDGKDGFVPAWGSPGEGCPPESQADAQSERDVRSILQRSEKEPYKNPVAFPPELKSRIWDFWDLRCSSLLFLFSFLPLSLSIPTANVTLDPDTAHPCLLLSEDHKTVRMGHKMQKVPDNPKRFSYYTFVLGREGFTAGRHSWEVRVGSEGAWAVGVTRESVDRKGLVYFCPEDGFWVLLYSQGTYEACIDPSSALPVSGEPKTIRVSLNCDGGWVAFHDADRGSLLYVFSGVSFAGETLFPFFYVGDDALLTISS
ncbi:butyrophilin subfamily 1 member A1-like [Varanus komodoensis]|uniref:butyrophilin subfamily 1 member A1-like n=1 Tax=Varanus komodoensis TaxID=61221 RepID=UPI001CF7B2F4|nr:butyrophilin subfamily 1 member A1-like [Varanus komodoensis]